MSLKEEDLIQDCPNCKGKGQIQDPPQESQGSTFGTYPIGRSTLQYCQRCSQTGKILTEQGEAILSVIQLAKRQNRI
jgi:hypothetical protein